MIDGRRFRAAAIPIAHRRSESSSQERTAVPSARVSSASYRTTPLAVGWSRGVFSVAVSSAGSVSPTKTGARKRRRSTP
nr:hypothetical protein [Halegenticoccus soli]